MVCDSRSFPTANQIPQGTVFLSSPISRLEKNGLASGPPGAQEEERTAGAVSATYIPQLRCPVSPRRGWGRGRHSHVGQGGRLGIR